MGTGLINTGVGFGGGGVRITEQVASQLSSIIAVAITKSNKNSGFQPGQATKGPYRPIGWANNDPTGQKARYSLSYALPQSSPTTQSSNANGQAATPFVIQGAPARSYSVFDAVIKATFNSRLKITDYPVQTGQNFSYNAVLEPVRIVMEVGVYDTVAAYDISMWGGASTKSVAALKLMQLLQQLRVPITINSRWGSYYPVLLEDITLPDSKDTYASAKMTLTFRQVFVANLAENGQSARNQTTDSTNTGNVPSTPVPASVSDNNTLSASQQQVVTNSQTKTLNSGIVSSNPTSSISSLVAGFEKWYGSQ